MALPAIVDFVLHIDKHLANLISSYGTTTYLILFGIVFCETGLVVLPFLPGDSLLFACGVFAAKGSLSLPLLFLVLVVSAILGDTVNYWVGAYLGPKIAGQQRIRFVKRAHIERTQAFYAKYGAKTVVIARFVPIVRTFAPFVAGVGSMQYGQFMRYNVIGAVLWAAVCVFAGYFLGGLPIVEKNFSIVVFAIIIISILPAVITVLRERSLAKSAAPAPKAEG